MCGPGATVAHVEERAGRRGVVQRLECREILQDAQQIPHLGGGLPIPLGLDLLPIARQKQVWAQCPRRLHR